MAKIKTQYTCSECGYQSAKWMGSCSSCGKWGTLKEEVVDKKTTSEPHKSRIDGLTPAPKPVRLSEVDEKSEKRFTSGISELDRVLGGGFVPGSFILLGGDPGIGKSTIALQIARSCPQMDILYTSGEESATQIRQRARRLNVSSEKMLVYTETDISKIIEEARKSKPELLIIDSIQTIYRTELTSMPGSVAQIRECAALLMQLAKREGITILSIGHVTKEGELAGPRVLEHMVDTVLQFEGDKNLNYRMIRSLKNRFGAAHEIGVFEMEEQGLREISNPSELFLSEYENPVSGSAIVCTMEGSRPILLEVQALVSPASYGTPQRTASGFDHKRLSLLLAVLEKRFGMPFSSHDVFLNIAGGLKINDTACDLGIIAALTSSMKEKPLPGACVIIGEVGLSGEVRKVSHLEARLNEISRMGMQQVVLPETKGITEKTLQLNTVRNVFSALDKLKV